MEKFKLKDAEANDVFERKIIYDLKKENDLLRRELSGMGASSFSVMNRIDTQQIGYTQNSVFEPLTERARIP